MLFRHNRNEPFWIELGDAGFLVRPLTASEHLALRKKHVRTRVKRGVPIEEFDHGKLGAEFFDRVICDWRGVEDEDGRPILCTTEEKRSLWEEDNELAADILEEMEEAQKHLREGARKNSSTSPSTPSDSAE